MPIDQRRRDDIATAVAAYDSANPTSAAAAQSPQRLLAVMFPSEDVCQRSQEAIAAEGFDRDRLPATLRRLLEAGLPVAGEPGSGRCPTPTACTCRRRVAPR